MNLFYFLTYTIPEFCILLREGNSCLIPAAIADYDITPLHGKSTLLDAYIDNKDKSLLRRITRFLHITKK